MTSPSGKDSHTAVWVAEPALAHFQRIPGRSHAKRVLLCGRARYPVQVALLAAVYLGAAKLGLTMAFVASGRAIWGTVGGSPWRRSCLAEDGALETAWFGARRARTPTARGGLAAATNTRPLAVSSIHPHRHATLAPQQGGCSPRRAFR
jgi:hypothetical protein